MNCQLKKKDEGIIENDVEKLADLILTPENDLKPID
jgi:hypothetical protein